MRKILKKTLNIFVSVAVFLIAWQIIVSALTIPKFLLPSPYDVYLSFVNDYKSILSDAKTTLLEIVLGMILGTIIGILNGLLLQLIKPLRRWLLPALVVSQSIPIYALAPFLVLWLGFDLAPKVVMVSIIIFFPITTSFFDGLRRADASYIDVLKSFGASQRTILFKVRIPSSLPSLGSGLRVASAFAPIGAIVGEWVGASSGLGYKMIYANARMQTAQMFSSLITLIAISLILYYSVDALAKMLAPWKRDTRG